MAKSVKGLEDYGIKNLEDFLDRLELFMFHGGTDILNAMSKTHLTEYMCRKYLNEAVEKGFYKKSWLRGDANKKNTPMSMRYLHKYYYTKIKDHATDQGT
jgi:hypothetical protein